MVVKNGSGLKWWKMVHVRCRGNGAAGTRCGGYWWW